MRIIRESVLKEKLKKLFIGHSGVWINALMGSLSLVVVATTPANPMDGLLWFSAGVGLSAAAWLWLLDKQRNGYEEIIDMQRKMMDEMASTFAQHAQSSHQTFKSSIQKFMEDQDDKPVNPNGPKVH